MIDATLITQRADRASGVAVFLACFEFAGLGAGSQSTELVRLDIPGLKSDTGDENRGIGNADLMTLCGINISSDSEDLDFHLITRGDTTGSGIEFLDTVYEVVSVTEIDLSYADSFFGDLVIANHDAVADNRLYVWLKNDDGSNATGTVTLELSFRLLD